jgi:ketosteroid isomerase-like protein
MGVSFITQYARWSIVGATLLWAPAVAVSQGGAPVTIAPQAALDELLAADRGFSAASANTDLSAGFVSMLADDVMMPVQGIGLAKGKIQVVEALLGSIDSNVAARAEWTPVRGGLSADGQHGFTLGFMTLRPANGSPVPLKYISYWVKGPEGWRVVAYKRARRPRGDVPLDLMAPTLPARIAPPSSDLSVIAGYRKSLDQAERGFSADAQRIGLRAAFVKYGSRDAMNVGGASSPGFVVGAENIARAVSAGEPAGGSTVSWAPDNVIVASSGDLGVTIGVIHPNVPDGGKGFPFFTIWRRASPSAPWRYVAE